MIIVRQIRVRRGGGGVRQGGGGREEGNVDV